MKGKNILNYQFQTVNVEKDEKTTQNNFENFIKDRFYHEEDNYEQYKRNIGNMINTLSIEDVNEIMSELN